MVRLDKVEQVNKNSAKYLVPGHDLAITFQCCKILTVKLVGEQDSCQFVQR